MPKKSKTAKFKKSGDKKRDEQQLASQSQKIEEPQLISQSQGKTPSPLRDILIYVAAAGVIAFLSFIFVDARIKIAVLEERVRNIERTLDAHRTGFENVHEDFKDMWKMIIEKEKVMGAPMI